jgi:type II secretory pathway pseudopilin PulG
MSAGSASRRDDRFERGYAMVTLLVAIALMGVFMSAAMPVWRQQVQREKEAELLWRGQQYDRAIQLYRQKRGAPGPPDLDVLVKEKFLRRKYKDPITGRDFALRPVGPAGSVVGEGDDQGPSASGRPRRRPPARTSGPGRTLGQLIGGVRSTSTERSIKIVNGKQKYSEWEFAYVPYKDASVSQAPAATPRRPGITPRGPVARPSRGPARRR